MALEKTLMTETGLQASYWKIIDCKINLLTSAVDGRIGLYKDRDFRLSNPNGTAEIRTFGFQDETMFPIVVGMTVAQFIGLIYEKIRTQKIGEHKMDESGNLLYEENGEPVINNTNFFQDAINIIE